MNFRIFPILLIALDVCAAIEAVISKKPAFAWYWISAASISAATLFMR